MATSTPLTTPTGQKPEAAAKDYRKYLSADVLAAGGGFASDLLEAKALREAQSVPKVTT